ncbi:MAG: hypothetical protein Edafosvirus14_15 [Edafosvirus sp.]|uniref:Uncharacterized protein n=1 Tax=Edafosvirus sp. TaxID=2487765 RepID=A0A3G4ZU87_9VIRU|nr:MAG: hypothetical protein Edafosvirus14_15 [Edafosvirus sp.]
MNIENLNDYNNTQYQPILDLDGDPLYVYLFIPWAYIQIILESYLETIEKNIKKKINKKTNGYIDITEIINEFNEFYKMFVETYNKIVDIYKNTWKWDINKIEIKEIIPINGPNIFPRNEKTYKLINSIYDTMIQLKNILNDFFSFDFKLRPADQIINELEIKFNPKHNII